MIEICGYCGADQRTDDGGWHTIGREIPGVYDGVLYWTCPFCGWAWHRWEPNTSARGRAAQSYIDQHNTGVIERELAGRPEEPR